MEHRTTGYGLFFVSLILFSTIMCTEAGWDEHQRKVKLFELFSYSPHLVNIDDIEPLFRTPSHSSTSATVFSTYTNTSLLLNSFGRAIKCSPNTSSPTMVVAGYTNQYNPNSAPQTSTGVQSATTIQTSYAMPALARFFYNEKTPRADTTLNPNAQGIDGVGTGVKGQVITNCTSNTYIFRMVIQPAQPPAPYTSQKIIVAGYTYLVNDSPPTTTLSGYSNLVTSNPLPSGYAVWVARYNWDGSLDTTFNPKGTQPGTVTAMPSLIPAQPYLNYAVSDQAFALGVDSLGRIVVAGTATGQLFVLRYNINGTLDTTFNPSGARYNFNKLPATVVNNNTTPGIFVCSILGTRSVSNAFVSMVGYDTAFDLVIQPDNKIVIAGTGASLIPPTLLVPTNMTSTATTTPPAATTNFNSFGTNQIIVMRLNTNGTPDNTFGQLVGNNVASGIQVTTIAGFDDRGLALALQSNGKIVVSGTSCNSNGFYGLALVRYTSKGLLDTSFGQVGQFINGINGLQLSLNGKVRLAVKNSPYAIANAVLVQPNSDIMLSGYNTYFVAGTTQFVYTLARFTTHGRLDTSFNPTGIPEGITNAVAPLGVHFRIIPQPGVQTVSIQGFTDLSFAQALQNDGSGKLLVAGSSFQPNSPTPVYIVGTSPLTSVGLTRLSEKGAVDAAFTTIFNYQ